MSKPAPLRKIIARDGTWYETLETLECGHFHEPKPYLAYPERHLHVERRRCRKCATEAAERARVLA